MKRVLRFLQSSLASRTKTVVAGLLVGTLWAVPVWGVLRIGWLDGLEQSSWNPLFLTRGARPSASPIVILEVDNKTIHEVGAFPLPRHVYADAVRYLTRAGARTIALNILMEVPWNDPAEDKALAVACRESGRVVQAAIYDRPPIKPEQFTLLSRFEVADEGAGFQYTEQIAPSLRALQEGAPALGHINLTPETDGSYQRVPHLIRYRNAGLYPSLALATAAHFLGLKPGEIVASPGELRLHPSPGHPLGQTTRRVPINRRGEAYINWAGGENTYPTYSLSDLFKGRVPARVLKGSIALIGIRRTGASKVIATPFSPIQPAVELQANVVDDIVANRVLREAASRQQLWMLFGFAMLCGALVASRGALGGVGWTLGLGSALWAGAVLLMARQNLYVPVVPPLLAGLLTCATIISYKEVRRTQENKRLQSIFGGYVGEEVLQQMQGRLPELGGEIRFVAVLFCDIQGFSGLAERLRDKPAELLGLLNEHFEPLVGALKDRGAYVDNYVGDLVMALFGAPISSGSPDTDTRNAVLAAADFVRIVRARNIEWQAMGRPAIEVGIGVHCGPAVVGNLGSRKKMHYTAIGDTVNIASRVESATRKYGTPLLVTEEVVNACQGHASMGGLEWEFADETTVKGRTAPVRFYVCKTLMLPANAPSIISADGAGVALEKSSPNVSGAKPT